MSLPRKRQRQAASERSALERGVEWSPRADTLGLACRRTESLGVPPLPADGVRQGLCASNGTERTPLRWKLCPAVSHPTGVQHGVEHPVVPGDRWGSAQCA